MSNEKQDLPDLLGRQICDHLDDTVAKTDGHTQSKLRQARAHAIEKGLANSRPFYLRPWLPAGIALASVAMLVILLVPLQPEQGGNIQDNVPALVAEDLDMLSQPEELELYEDLEFYRWMSASEMG